MDAVCLRDGHVLVPLVAEAAVARVGLSGLVQDRHGPRDGLEVEFGLPVAEGARVAAEGGRELAGTGMDVPPRMGSVFEAGSVSLVVVGDGLPCREEALCGVVPFVVGGDLLKPGFVRVRQIPKFLKVVAATSDLGEMLVDVRVGFAPARVLSEDGVDPVACSFGKFLDGRVLPQFLQTVDEPFVPRQVEGIDVGGPGLGDVRLPVSMELVHRALRDRSQQLRLPRLDREQRALEVVRCLDQRLALARHGGQMAGMGAVLRQHPAHLGEQGLRPLPPAA